MHACSLSRVVFYLCGVSVHACSLSRVVFYLCGVSVHACSLSRVVFYLCGEACMLVLCHVLCFTYVVKRACLFFVTCCASCRVVFISYE